MPKPAPHFVCPECGFTILHEKEIGPILTREVRQINWQYHHTVYENYWVSEDGKKWWLCGQCGWKIPVADEQELVAWLKERLEERKVADG